MLEVSDLCKRFGALEVTKNVSMRLEKGERRVILGPNGAGKTTLFNQLVGEIIPDSGSIKVNGQEVGDWSVEKRARFGLSRSYQQNTLFDGITIGESLGLAAAVSTSKSMWFWKDSLQDADVKAIVRDTAEQVGLEDNLGARVSDVSYGIRRQLEVGLALATRPSVLLMDEPTSGVGPEMIGAFHRLLGRLSRELTIVIIEHDMDLAFDVADSMTVLNYGEVVFEGTPGEARESEMLQQIYLGAWDDA
ncbi:ABC transporter ATP-binding protein [Marinobacterium mangrovicola]|uniref:Amino acid/amide ABC transporter ATP-binding protein 1 (HAAT family) n=1 Tax=Marinobacterium mangrovicola TaxID=1476959 RepID=A0A4R1GIP2_9GAMM|nr:ATP-binding cassette domain-containing protein [Marinobacterium mangrovicola]TCK06970.1 amino acid/amide ABC transporter ATP-binding protein 1 (HAAT family) [Marinobacterium mangrovicola]